MCLALGRLTGTPGGRDSGKVFINYTNYVEGCKDHLLTHGMARMHQGFNTAVIYHICIWRELLDPFGA